MPGPFDLFTAPFISRSEKRFHTTDAPDVALRVVENITVNDFAPNGLPPVGIPMVTRPGKLNFIGPGSGFDSTFEVRPTRDGGADIIEHKTAVSMIPGFSRVMTAVHDVVTSPQQAYASSRRRGG